jgi:hypothetical protein
MKDSMVNDAIVKDKTYHLQKVLFLPILVLLALTGCSTMSGTSAQNDPAKNTRNYMEQSSNLPEDINGDDDPDYEWFY